MIAQRMFDQQVGYPSNRYHLIDNDEKFQLTVDVDSFTATLKNGVLVVSAPKDLSKLEENVRKIPITPLEDIVGESKKQTDTSAGDEKESVPVENTDTKIDASDDSTDE